ncbi:MAG: hypothetical protein JXR83_13395 [Deltaproteobacteria bacterium]|nr:hypothetical protein [Deltaproteobacteria bacterium]
MRTRIAELGLALLLGSFTACDCGTTTPGQNKDGGNNPNVDGSGPGLDGGGGLDLVGRDTAPAADRFGWVPDDSGAIVPVEGGVIITEDGGTQWQCVPMKCYANGPLECADCQDNDNDGKIDWRDPECLGPCDNTEGPGLESGVGGTTDNNCGVDCYFDFGSGWGNDQCAWDHRCDPLSPEALSNDACAYDQAWTNSHQGQNACPPTQTQQCLDFCLPITPNGCDCFGCCTFPDLAGLGPNGDPGYVWIGNMITTDAGQNTSTCTMQTLTDPVACPPCTPVVDCLNECGHCEICVGKPTLPEDCYQGDAGVRDAWVPQIDAGGRDAVGVDLTAPHDAAQPDAYEPPRCDPGVNPCGLPDDPPCDPPFYCVTGCCIYFGG